MIKLLEQLFNGFDDLNTIEYSYVNGEESLKINGKEVIEKKEEDTEFKTFVDKYTEIIEELDDCTFVEVMEQIENDINIKELDDLIHKDNLTNDEKNIVKFHIEYIYKAIKENLENKLEDINNLLKKL